MKNSIRSQIDAIFDEIQIENILEISNSSIIASFKQLQSNLGKKKGILANTLCEETKKPISYCEKEVDRCISILDDAIACIILNSNKTGLYSTNIETINWISRSIPVGLVLGFTPVSSAYSSFIQKMCASVIYRNAFICKPSPKTVKSSQCLFDIVKNSVCFDKAVAFLPLEDEEYTSYVLQKKTFDCLLFTGKNETAKTIKGIIGRKRAVFETGSNAMTYISNTVNTENILTELIENAFQQSGMRCVALKNLFIQEEVFEQTLTKLVDELKNKCIYGAATDRNTKVGPIVDGLQLDSLIKYIEKLKKNGYTVLYGGRIVDGNLLMPTVLADHDDSFLSIEEAFGPVLCVHRVKSIEDIPKQYFRKSSINVSIYSNCKQEIERWIEMCKSSGCVYINHGPGLRIDLLPFGGSYEENEGKEGMEELKKILTNEQIVAYC